MKVWVFLIFLAGFVRAQPVSIGVKGGVPATDFFDRVQSSSPLQSLFRDDTPRYLLGPTVELHGPMGLSLEVDALYRRFGYEYTVTSVDTITHVRTHSDAWQFPVLAKWAFLPGPVKPFVDGGLNVQHVFSVHQISTLTVVPSHVTTTIADTSRDLANDTTLGFAFGGGVQLKIGKLRIEPEFRYTRWGTEAFRDPANSVLTTRLNQGDFILGLTF